jgi:hypothetical protein
MIQQGERPGHDAYAQYSRCLLHPR